jgi:hypothetical protein
MIYDLISAKHKRFKNVLYESMWEIYFTLCFAKKNVLGAFLPNYAFNFLFDFVYLTFPTCNSKGNMMECK